VPPECAPECRGAQDALWDSQSPQRRRARDSLLCPGSPRSGVTASAQCACAMTPSTNGSTACRMRLHAASAASGPRPLRHCGRTPAPTPTGDYPPRASHFPGGQRKLHERPGQLLLFHRNNAAFVHRIALLFDHDKSRTVAQLYMRSVAWMVLNHCESELRPGILRWYQPRNAVPRPNIRRNVSLASA
jgi:hypothetical protein